jgi:DNA-binding MarR family transcriptional regulator
MSQDPLAFRVFNEIGIIEQLSRTLFERVMPASLTLPQFTVLNHLVRLGGDRSPARLAAAFQVTKQTMTSTLQRLERGGYVAIRPDPADGRAKLVSITEDGRAMREACVRALEPELERLAALIDEASLQALLPGLVDLRRILDEDRSRPARDRAVDAGEERLTGSSAGPRRSPP